MISDVFAVRQYVDLCASERVSDTSLFLPKRIAMDSDCRYVIVVNIVFVMMHFMHLLISPQLNTRNTAHHYTIVRLSSSHSLLHPYPDAASALVSTITFRSLFSKQYHYHCCIFPLLLTQYRNSKRQVKAVSGWDATDKEGICLPRVCRRILCVQSHTHNASFQPSDCRVTR